MAILRTETIGEERAHSLFERHHLLGLSRLLILHDWLRRLRPSCYVGFVHTHLLRSPEKFTTTRASFQEADEPHHLPSRPMSMKNTTMATRVIG
ncbi:hypothetical protein LMTR13_24955 [Bradyrhizobium icense]|uniref:Uncharacterized protein n=1 Tax=Bradyrhizobium icense TaxID=1274631 RepID=A0A1B1UJJ1_9BRAD|nr:hypothetical protein LMTR13_24955 [Bradyrhizobium icense]